MSVELNDGLSYDTTSLSAQSIREDDDYYGVRVSATVTLATAKLHFHLDINFGDPIWPEPTIVLLPRLLGTDPIRITGYPQENRDRHSTRNSEHAVARFR